MRRSSHSAYGLAALVGVLLLRGLPSRAETLAEIENLSLVVNWTQHSTGIDPSGRPFSGNSQWTTRLYISSKGNVFSSPAETNRINPGPRVFAVGTTTDQGGGYAVTWAMADGHLTQTSKYPQGSTDLVFAIDPAHMTCVFELRRHPDPRTGLITPRTSAGTVQLRSIETLSSSCNVTRGNIFATE